MKDIARMLGVSVATVSRALQDSPSISKKRREEIQQFAREHNYFPNVIAEQLRNSRRSPVKMIGVIVPELVHYYFSAVLSGIEAAADLKGYRILVAQSKEQYDREVKICESFYHNKVCGIIVSQAKDTVRYEHFKKLEADGVPLVFYDRICPVLNASRVVVDDYMGALKAVSYLIERGCRRIAYYGTSHNMEIGKNRFNGYRDTMRRHHLAIDERLVCQCDNRAEAEALTPTLLALEPRPDGFFTINDDTALGVLYSAKRHGFNVPRDLQICGFADGIRARSCEPSLTTIEQRGDAVGREAAQVLLDTLQGRVPAGQFLNRIVKTKLVVRNTTLPPQSDKVEG